MREFEAQLVLDAHAILAEGPHWDEESQRLLWVNITPGEIHWFDPASGRDTHVNVRTMVGAAVPRESGGLVLAVESGFAILEDGKDMRMISDVEADIPGNRMNDGKCDSQGRFWAGTMDRETKEKGAALYRLDPNHELQTAVFNVTLSNGLGWSPDDTLMYYIDSMTRNVDVFGYDAATGRISDRRTVIEITDGGAVPDGMTADAEGFVWVALYGAGKVRRYDPKGVPVAEVSVPATAVTSCAFGGPDLGDLYITTAAQMLSPEELERQPSAGGIFRVRPGVAGQLPHRFRG